ncbi:MAG: DUF2236 domain-containing protein [Actinobacteria bacterium]|nr:DUF2236 domain-containing protein [Actinomycetota bacterium]
MATIPALKESISSQIVRALGGRADETDWSAPAGDPGIIPGGPRSVTWKVHSDLGSMLVGGISALLLQTLHPFAMAGVADHSDFRDDPTGRLQRTGGFIATTTYGSTEAAEQAIEIVKRVHARVTGAAPDGRPYSANDPDLLAWVHVAEVDSFLRSHVRYGPNVILPAQQDRYYDEVSVVAEELGARGVPKSRAEVLSYYESMRPLLCAGGQALETVDFILEGGRGRSPQARAYKLICDASIGLLPGWAKDELGLYQRTVIDLALVRPAAMALFTAIRWAMGPSPIVAAARERTETVKSTRAPSRSLG